MKRKRQLTPDAPWEFTNIDDMYLMLVGLEYGQNPTEAIKKIWEDKAKQAEFIAKTLDLKPHHNCLDLGSGSGFIAHKIAPKVKNLYCCDISHSFLEEAKKNLAEYTNTSFHQVSPASTFDFINKNLLDRVYSHNVFIHLNIYDIYLYLNRLNKKMINEGLIFFDFLDLENPSQKTLLDFKKMASYYQEEPRFISVLLNYHSLDTIHDIAALTGFRVYNEFPDSDAIRNIVLQKVDPSHLTKR